MRSDSNLTWSKHPNGHWHRLAELDIDALAGHGVYVVWHGGYPSRVVCVGGGVLADELRALQEHPEAALYTEAGPLYVTWAAVDPSLAAGICRYLAGRLRPLIEDDVSSVAPIATNSPF